MRTKQTCRGDSSPPKPERENRKKQGSRVPLSHQKMISLKASYLEERTREKRNSRKVVRCEKEGEALVCLENQDGMGGNGYATGQ